MCNAYTIRKRVPASELDELVSSEIGKLPSPLVRRLGTGLVVTRFNNGLIPQRMRWGFPHAQYKSVNNARCESLKRGMWVEPMAKRRCLVPMSSFFEWQPLIGQAKQAYEIQLPSDDWLWVAGLHGTDESCGPCYATITTEPTESFAKIHDRLLAIVTFEQGMEFLSGNHANFTPYTGPLAVRPSESPLKKRLDIDDPQGRLF